MNIILVLSVAAFCATQTLCDDTLVQVRQGWLQGKVQDAVIGDFQYISFENIPYAKPPTGSLRFKAPEEPESWEGVRDATALGTMCPQYNSLTNMVNIGSEDCLTANVYTLNTSGNFPVIVLFTGYAYSFDVDDVSIYKPDFMVGNAVIVKFNYRLDAFGFINLGNKDVPGNAGLKDQVQLLRWVRDNIAAFGGNPNSVTLVGMSSGSASIYHHMMSPMSSGLFHKAVMISGVPSCDPIYPYQVQQKSFYLAEKLGFTTKDKDVDEVLTFLQAIPYETLINSSYALAREDQRNQLFKKMSTFLPVVEEDFGQDRFITQDPMTSLESAPLNQVELVIGFCDKEALIIVKESAEYLIDLYKTNPELFVPSKILLRDSSTIDVEGKSTAIKQFYFKNKDVSVENIKEFVEMNSFAAIIYDIIRFARKISQFTDTYLFEFKSTSSRNLFGLEGLKYGIKGASHGDLTGYMFPLTELNMTIDVDSTEFALIQQAMQPLADFVTTGNPSLSMDITWKKFTTKGLHYVEVTDRITPKRDPRSKEYRFWDRIYADIQ